MDPTGHKWSWKKFWHAAVGVFVGVVATMLLGPGGAFMITQSWALAGGIGGALGGALSGGLEGGWKGALIGGAMGGALGAFGGWASSIKDGAYAGWVLAGGIVAGAGVAAATDSWDSFAGGLAGGLAGWGAGTGINKSVHSWRAKNDGAFHDPNSGASGKNDGNPNKALIVDKGKGASGDPKIDDPEVRNQILKAVNDNITTGNEQGGQGNFKYKMFERYPPGNTEPGKVTPFNRHWADYEFHTHLGLHGPGQDDWRMITSDFRVMFIKDHYVGDTYGIVSYGFDQQGNKFQKDVWSWNSGGNN